MRPQATERPSQTNLGFRLTEGEQEARFAAAVNMAYCLEP